MRGQKAQPYRGDRVNFSGLTKVCEIYHLGTVNACVEFAIYPAVVEIVRSGSTERQTSRARLKEAAARLQSQQIQEPLQVRNGIPSPQMDGLIQ